MISGIIIIAVIVIFLLIGIKRGIAITVLNIAGIIVTAVSAYYLSQMLSDFLYDAFLSQSVANNLKQIITQNGTEYASHNYLDSLPDWINGVILFLSGVFGAQFGGKPPFESFTSITTNEIVHTMEKAVRDVATGAMRILLYLLLAVLIFIIVKLIIKKLAVLFKVPVIKQLNKFFGGLLGFVEGVVFVFIAVNVFYLVMNANNPDLLSNQNVFGYIFNFLCLFS